MKSNTKCSLTHKLVSTGIFLVRLHSFIPVQHRTTGLSDQSNRMRRKTLVRQRNRVSHMNRVKQQPSLQPYEPCVNRKIRRLSLLNPMRQLSHLLNRMRRKKPEFLLSRMKRKNRKSQTLLQLIRKIRMNREIFCQLLQSQSERQHPSPTKEPDRQIPSS